jgi:hypothetical protein
MVLFSGADSFGASPWLPPSEGQGAPKVGDVVSRADSFCPLPNVEKVNKLKYITVFKIPIRPTIKNKKS